MLVEKILCYLVGFVLFVAAFRFLHKDKLAQAFVMFMMAVGAFVTSLSGVQALIRTGLLASVKKSLISYGDKVNNFQIALGNMQQDLEGQQQFLTNQQAKIVQTQNDLDKQQRKLEDIDNLLNEFFTRTRFENITGSDTNKVFIMHLEADLRLVFLKLSDFPLHGSPQVLLGGDINVSPLFQSARNIYGINNVLVYSIRGNADTKNQMFIAQYVIDPKAGATYQLFTNLVVTSNTVLMNNQTFTFNPKTGFRE